MGRGPFGARGSPRAAAGGHGCGRCPLVARAFARALGRTSRPANGLRPIKVAEPPPAPCQWIYIGGEFFGLRVKKSLQASPSKSLLSGLRVKR